MATPPEPTATERATTGPEPSAPTRQDCECHCSSYGQHLRRKGIRVAYTNSTNGWDASKQKRWDGELQRYRDLSASGIDPDGTTHTEMDRTERRLEKESQSAPQD